jgi:hypothetical protein
VTRNTKDFEGIDNLQIINPGPEIGNKGHFAPLALVSSRSTSGREGSCAMGRERAFALGLVVAVA